MRRTFEDTAVAATHLLRRVSSTRSDVPVADAARDVLPLILRASSSGTKPGEWTVLRTVRSQTEAAVAVLGRGGEAEIVVKLAETPELVARLHHESSVLGRLALGATAAMPLLPKPIAAGEHNGRHFLATRALRGIEARALRANSVEQHRALAEAARAIARFHACSAVETPVDEPRVREWSEPALVALVYALGGSSDHIARLDTVRETVIDGLVGRSLGVGWSHGDYWLGNVLVAPAGAPVTGIVDWDTAGDGRLQLLDILHLLLYTRVTAGRAQLGDVVVELVRGGPWLPHEERVLQDTAPHVLADARLRRAALLLCWLQHVGANLGESPSYAASTIWMRRNVREVLTAAASTIAAPPAPAAGTLPLPAPAAHREPRPTVRASLATLLPRADLFVPLSLVCLSCGLWAGALRQVDLTHMTDLGLISVLPPSMFAALAALVAGFVISVRQTPVRQPLLLLHVVVLILILFGTPAVVEEVPRFAVTWRHVGIADYVMRRHAVNATIDAYFNWPGFFSLLAFFDGAAGLKDPLGFANWAPAVLNLLYLGPLLLIFKAVFEDRRLVWVGAWLFYLTNWIGQDYLSPQGLAYFVYLALVALVLRWFVHWRAHAGRMGGGDPGVVLPLDEQTGSARPTQEVALVAVAIALFAVLIPLHQLTPFAALAAISILVALRLSPLRGMPLLGAVLTATWLVFMANSFLAGHFGGLANEVGDVQGSVAANVGTRVTGSLGHLTVVATRLFVTGSWWLLALAGAIRARRSRLPILPIAALALAPFPLILLQTYGGEILLRVYLFALPFTVFFAVMLFTTERRNDVPRLRGGPWGLIALASLSAVLVVSMFVTRYGNERMDAFTRDEVRAATAVYATAPARANVITANTNMPWKFRNYEDYNVTRLTSMPNWPALARPHRPPAAIVHEIRQLADGTKQPTYVILTTSQQAEIDILQEGPRDVVARLRTALEATRDFHEIVSYPDAAVFIHRAHSGVRA